MVGNDKKDLRAKAGDERMRVPFLSQEDPWNRKWQPTLVFFCLENPMDRKAWRATVHRVAKSQV